jgi:hypothetical protein
MERTLRNNPQNAERIAMNIKKEDELKEVIATSGDELSAIGKARTVESPTWYHQLAASGILATATGLGDLVGGGGFFSVAGKALAAGSGMVATSRLLASPTTQKVIAGQSPLQQAAVRGLQQPVPLTGIRAIDAVTALPRVGAGMLTGQEEYKPQ